MSDSGGGGSCVVLREVLRPGCGLEKRLGIVFLRDGLVCLPAWKRVRKPKLQTKREQTRKEPSKIKEEWTVPVDGGTDCLRGFKRIWIRLWASLGRIRSNCK